MERYKWSATRKLRMASPRNSSRSLDVQVPSVMGRNDLGRSASRNRSRRRGRYPSIDASCENVNPRRRSSASNVRMRLSPEKKGNLERRGRTPTNRRITVPRSRTPQRGWDDPSSDVSPEKDGCVVAAEPECVADCNIDLPIPSCVRDVIEVAFLVRDHLVDGWMDFVVDNRKDRRYRLDCTCCTQQVSDH